MINTYTFFLILVILVLLVSGIIYYLILKFSKQNNTIDNNNSRNSLILSNRDVMSKNLNAKKPILKKRDAASNFVDELYRPENKKVSFNKKISIKYI